MKRKFLNLIAFGLLGFGIGVHCATEQAAASSIDVLSYEYSGTGDLNFQSSTTLNIAGVCSTACGPFTVTMSISGGGPAGDPTTSGWYDAAFATVTDNLGDTTSVGVDTGNYLGTHHNIYGSFLYASILPSVLNISTSSFTSSSVGPLTVDYSITIGLPDGVSFTPLPDSLPLFITGLVLIGTLGWFSKRKGAAVTFA
jgi:hypothetical protein